MKRFCFIFFITFCLFSCNTHMSRIIKNNDRTKSMVVRIFNLQHNVYYIASTYSNYSTIWYYQGNTIVIIKLRNGRVIEKRSHLVLSHIFQEKDYYDALLEMECQLITLDGDCLGGNIKINGAPQQFVFYINIPDFVSKKFNSIVLQRLASDIKHYDLWPNNN